MEFRVLLLTKLCSLFRLYQSDSVPQVILHLLTDLGSRCIYCVSMGEREMGDGLLVHPVVMLSINSLFTLCFDRVNIGTHFLDFFLFGILLFLNVLLHLKMLLIKLSSLCVDLFLSILMFFDFFSFHALKVLIKQPPPL